MFWHMISFILCILALGTIMRLWYIDTTKLQNKIIQLKYEKYTELQKRKYAEKNPHYFIPKITTKLLERKPLNGTTD